MNIPFGDSRRQYLAMKDEIDSAVGRVFESGWYILGKEVDAFEREFAAYLGVRHCIGVGNGTDAIEIALRALGIKSGDEVITVSHTAAFTAIGIVAAGATVRFVDIEPLHYTMDPALLESAINERTRAIVPVHLYGHPADLTTIERVARTHGLDVIEDAAQAHGASLAGRKVGSIGRLGCFSFYPSKNLGAFGDGGAITTNDDALAERVRWIRNGGQAKRYDHAILGVNSRLDELQAAILRAELPHLDERNARRRAIVERYRKALAAHPALVLPAPDAPDAYAVQHLFVVRTKLRSALQSALALRGIATQVHYPVPTHLQPAFAAEAPPSLPVTEGAAAEILSLPAYPELRDEEVDYVATKLRETLDAL